jgi:hypothetical protein
MGDRPQRRCPKTDGECRISRLPHPGQPLLAMSIGAVMVRGRGEHES